MEYAIKLYVERRTSNVGHVNATPTENKETRARKGVENEKIKGEQTSQPNLRAPSNGGGGHATKRRRYLRCRRRKSKFLRAISATRTMDGGGGG